jgi:hypothetical protein
MVFYTHQIKTMHPGYTPRHLAYSFYLWDKKLIY